MIVWKEVPREAATLFNPAFMAMTVGTMVESYYADGGRPLPLPLAVIGTAIALSPTIRKDLPKRVDSSMITWLHEHPEHRVQVPVRARALVDSVRYGILFGARYGAIKLASDATLLVGGWARGRTKLLAATSELDETVKYARFVGRWLASAGSTGTVLTVWGVVP